jgi:HSP20 family molecular chaperone IbpA
MRFTKLTATALAMAPTLSRAFTAAAPQAKKAAAAATSTRLAVGRDHMMLPLLRRSRMMYDIDRMFEEMDQMMESSLASFPRPYLSLADKNIPTDLQLRRPLGFEIEPGEKEYNIKVHVPDVEAKDLNLHLQHDGRVLRLKGERNMEEGGMRVQSSFEKSILLAPDVDLTQLTASMTGDTLTVHAPKLEQMKSLEEKTEQIPIHFEEPTAALEGAPKTEEEAVDKTA